MTEWFSLLIFWKRLLNDIKSSPPPASLNAFATNAKAETMAFANVSDEMREHQVERILRDNILYFGDKALRDALEKRLLDELNPKKAGTNSFIIVAHSLGSIVAFRLLLRLSAAQAHLSIHDPALINVPLFVTVGSPLARSVVKRQLREHF